ncbi:COMM domain-containing protein 8 [Holothuria leucospilota]|uniref:COMM domain-containing protein 8 n=1 Tax=Holothuria leucospilota TaxID=206669 RepID=A0A9Q1BKB8_HOLLE|nr:COMM domain-containing protein 8 [Holothuria leucospilota]
MAKLPQEELHLNLIEKCPEDKIDGLLHYSVDSLCRSCHPDYSKYSAIWTLEEWFNVLDSLKKILIFFAKSDLSKSEVSDALSPLPEQIIAKIFDCLTVRRSDLHAALLQQTMSISEAYLKDFDWKIKYALASDKISCVEEPLVTLSLTVSEEGCKKTIPVEMNAEELKSLITSLEAANKAVLQLKS